MDLEERLPSCSLSSSGNHHSHNNEEISPSSLDLQASAPFSASEEDTPKAEEEMMNNQSSSECKSSCTSVVDILRYAASLALLGFSIAILSAAIFSKQTTATATGDDDGSNNGNPIHPALAFAIFWVLLIWLSYLEGGLNCLVGLQPIDRALYQESHIFTHRCTTLTQRGDNLERFIVGRQYLDLSIVFITSFMVSSIDGAQVLGLPGWVNDIFLGSGLAVTLITIVCGQLVAQINAAHCMLDFVNNRILWVSTMAALCVEASGILHAVYLIQFFFAKLSGSNTTSNNSATEHKRSTGQAILFWARVVVSVILLLVSLAVTLTALFQGRTAMWEGIPAYGSLLLLIGLIAVGGLMEGLQIALFAVVHLPPGTLEQASSRVQKHCDYLFRGSSLEAFLIGRQICQTVIMFVIARITTVDVSAGEENLFGVSDGVQRLFGSGVLGALISTIIASLAWRVIASSFPMVFLGNPFAGFIIQACLAVEGTGICYSAWIFAYLQRRLLGFQKDSFYVGTAEERFSGDEEEGAAGKVICNQDEDLKTTLEGCALARETLARETTEESSSGSSQNS